MGVGDPSEPPPRNEGAGDERDRRRRSWLRRRLAELWSVPTYRFAGLFLAFLVGTSLIYPWLRLRFGPLFSAAERGTAELVFWLMSLFSSEVTLKGGNVVSLGPFPVKIIEECTGIYEALLLGAALLAFPTDWYRSALGFALGFPLIYAMNVARIVLLLVVGRYYPEAFHFMHIYFWQVTMIVMVASTWLLWVVWVVRGFGPDRKPAP